MKKYLCRIIYEIIAIHLPKSNIKYIGKYFKIIRVFLAKNYIKYSGKNINIQKGAIFGPSLSIGDKSMVGINCVLGDKVEIGSNVMMGPQCYIYTRNHKHNKTDVPMIEQGYEEEKHVIIGNDVWIGSRVTILPGIHIGNGVIIGASSVVTHDIPDYVIAAGNPAKIVKKRIAYNL